MKNINLWAVMMGAALMVSTACSKDDDNDNNNNTTPEGSVVKSGLISADETWTSDKIYILSNKVVVESGVELTIEAGTIIKGRAGQGSLASALVISRGAKINAVGTASEPIIFTAEVDNIAKGQTVGTNLTKSDNKLWGGLIILGAAPISAENGDIETNIEGIPAEDGYGLFGGADAADNSGMLKYVSIRHGGISIGEGNEINGLTLGGVGTGTQIENVEVYATLDDGIECFGGTVNINNALVFYQGDDGLDLDMNYSGTISNFAVIHGNGIGTDEGLEIDGPEGSTYTTGLYTLMNGICKSEGTDPSAADLKSKAQGHHVNVSFIGYGSKAVKIRASFNSDCTTKTDALSHMLSTPSKLDFTDCSMEALSVYDAAGTTSCPTELAAAQTAAEAAVNMSGAGATLNIAGTFGWTCAGERGEL